MTKTSNHLNHRNYNLFALLDEDDEMKEMKVNKKEVNKKVNKKIVNILRLTSSPDRPFVCGSWANEDNEPLDFTQPLHL
jgi:hypothetical protein